ASKDITRDLPRIRPPTPRTILHLLQTQRCPLWDFEGRAIVPAEAVQEPQDSWLCNQPVRLVCIANKMINGSQCTIVWHVDDLKISHVDSTVIDDIIASLKEEYGQG
ncbi:hypothetical protein ACHAXR_007723, partial [Thalassiosira sp. AJA248-18]